MTDEGGQSVVLSGRRNMHKIIALSLSLVQLYRIYARDYLYFVFGIGGNFLALWVTRP